MTVTVGLIPTAPQNLIRVQALSETSIQGSWQPGLEIMSNPETLSYKIYLDDGSGNNPVVFWDSAGVALSNIATLTSLQTSTVYSATVTATNVIGESLTSDALTIYTGMVPSKITTLKWESSSTTTV